MEQVNSTSSGKSFEERINETKLTRTSQKIAEYCLQNKSILAFQPLTVIAAQLGISDISIVRFARALGYEGFTDMKQHIHEELAELIDGNPGEVNTLAAFTTNMERNKIEKYETAQDAADRYCSMIRNTLDRSDMATIEQIADCLITTGRHFIVGFFSLAGSAELLRTILMPMLSDIYAITSMDLEGISLLSNIAAGDSVVLFSFGRSTQYERAIVDAAVTADARLIVITDQPDSPAAQAADHFLYAKANAGHPFHSNVCSTMLAELIASYVAINNWAVSKDRLGRLDMHIANLTGK